MNAAPLDDPIRFEVTGPLASVVLNRPAKHNALTAAMVDELAERIAEVRGDNTVRCLVLRGAGHSFCAGEDLGGSGPRPVSLDLADRWERSYVRVVSALLTLRIPTLAVLHGHVLGAGLDLALGCDFRVAGTSTELGTAVVKRGLGGAGVYLLANYLGFGRATELLLLGRSVPADEAHTLGLVTEVHDDAELERVADEWTARLCSAPTGALGAIKAARNRCLGIPPRTGLEAQLETSLDLQFLRDPVEGRNAWRERRPPEFPGGYRPVE
jgi:2-(1,2-epoxy-1,2-dihydrophenyl)acetyl-CoA isomerase